SACSCSESRGQRVGLVSQAGKKFVSASSRNQQAGSLRFPTDATTREALSFHSVECFLEQFQVRSTASLFTGRLDPFFLERVLGRTIGFVKHAKDAGERERGEFICGELVGNVVAHFILGCAVPFSFLAPF